LTMALLASISPIDVYDSLIFSNLLRLRDFLDEFGTIIDKYSCFNKSVKECLTTASVCIGKGPCFAMHVDTALLIQSLTFFLSQ